MIRGILFDFGQTLVDSAEGFKAAEKKAKDRIFADLFPAQDEKSWEAFLPVYRRMRKEFHQRSEFSRSALWQAVYRHFNRTPDPARLEDWESEYWRQVKALTTPFPETVPVLEKLAGSYRLALITNTQGQKSEGSHRIALFPELERFFAVIIVAGESGVPPKPDRRPFRICLEKLGLAPHEAVFVGDDWRIDIGGAADAGIQPVWIRHHTVKRNWPDVEATVPMITRLDQLIDHPVFTEK